MKPIDQITPTRFRTTTESIVPIAMPIVVIIIAVFSIINNVPPYGTLLLFLLSIALFTFKPQTEVDLVEMRYRDLWTCLGLRVGKWKPLDPPESVLISKYLKRSSMPATKAMTATFSSVFWDVNIITTGSRDVIISRKGTREEAVILAKEVAFDLKVRVQEKTSNDYVWLTE